MVSVWPCAGGAMANPSAASAINIKLLHPESIAISPLSGSCLIVFSENLPRLFLSSNNERPLRDRATLPLGAQSMGLFYGFVKVNEIANGRRAGLASHLDYTHREPLSDEQFMVAVVFKT